MCSCMYSSFAKKTVASLGSPSTGHPGPAGQGCEPLGKGDGFVRGGGDDKEMSVGIVDFIGEHGGPQVLGRCSVTWEEGAPNGVA